MVSHHVLFRSGASPATSPGPDSGSVPHSRKPTKVHIPRAIVESLVSPEKTLKVEGAPAKPTTVAISEARDKDGIWLWETTKSLAGGLYGLLRIDKLGWGGDGNSKQKVELLGDTTQRAVKVLAFS